MSSINEAIFSQNLKRMEQYRGQTFLCDQCGKEGEVGVDMVAGTGVLIPSMGVRAYWIHKTCAEELFGQ